MNTRLGTAITSALVAATLILGNAAPAQASGQRALWVWDGPVEGVIEFATSRGISDLYLHAPPGFSGDDAYAPFIDAAHNAGLAVLATGGDPSWATDSAPWNGWVDEVVAFGEFDAVVFDVEPHTLAQWNSKRRNRLIRSYLGSLAQASQRAGSLPTYSTVPFWWDDPTFKTKKQLLIEHVLDVSDGIIVMAYRDHALGTDGIVELSRTEAALASTAGKQFTIGVETGSTSLDKVSFAEEGAAALEAELSIVESIFGSTAGYFGVSIHHYGSYRTMLP